MLIRRRIDTAHNFANKPVFFACNGVQIRRRVRHKAGTEEGGRTARNSRNASRARKKILPKAARMGGGVPGDRRKARRRVVHGAASRAHNGGEARGKGQREGGEAAHRGGYRGRKREAGAGVEDKKARRGEKDRRGVVVWVQLLARAYIYSCYI